MTWFTPWRIPMNNMDKIIQAHFPTVMAPVEGALSEIEVNKSRLIIAENGVFIETKKEWGYFRLLTSMVSSRPLPYGCLTEVCRITAPPMSRQVRMAIRSDAMRHLPNEFAGHVLVQNGQLIYKEALLDPAAKYPRSPSHINYLQPAPEEGDVILDVHSHGHGKPYFSQTDYNDMKGGTYIALVLGRCERGENMIFEFGLNVAGFLFLRLPEVLNWLVGKNQTKEN